MKKEEMYKITHTENANYNEKELKKKRLLAILAVLMVLTAGGLNRCAHEEAKDIQEKYSYATEQAVDEQVEFTETVKGK